MLLKRLFDICSALTALVLLSPFLFLVSALILVIDGRPIIFGGRRVGLAGKEFRLYKFRTMHAAGSGLSPAITLGSKDQRITRLGAFFRQRKVDELPQLLNVLRGDMSLVGPRPESPDYVSQYSEGDREVLQVPAGLTDITVLRGHLHDTALLDALPEEKRETAYREVLMPRKLLLNRDYARHCTFFGDLKILFGTTLSLLGLRVSEPPEELRSLLARYINS